MTVDQFIHEVQAYYGPYNPTQRKYIAQWLAKRSERAISYIFSESLKTVEAKYKQPPCVADLERCYKEVREHKVELMAPPPVPLLEEDAVPREELGEKLNVLLGDFARKASVKE